MEDAGVGYGIKRNNFRRERKGGVVMQDWIGMVKYIRKTMGKKK